jgi:Cys/Met metabolism PLP-dependent enzyme
MEVQDVPAIADAAHSCDVLVALDNTWGVLFDAFSHGVDISVQALTKYVGGTVTCCLEQSASAMRPCMSVSERSTSCLVSQSHLTTVGWP